jgi:hypothetical protein
MIPSMGKIITKASEKAKDLPACKQARFTV